METIKSRLGTFDMLQVGLVLLKVANLIDWSWWQVFMPLIVIVVASAILAVVETARNAEDVDELESELDSEGMIVVHIPIKEVIDWEAVHESIRKVQENIEELKE